MEIKEKVKTFLNKYNLLQPETRVLAAFSGGYDSLCLLHILKELGANVIAIHLNHNWRKDESLSDENNCREFCKNNYIDFYTETLSQKIPKTETAARDARYDFFEKCAEKFKADAVLTAHNANDNAETLIYRIAKGTGTMGLCGIAETRGIFYRPLLDCSRNEIEDYCRINNLKPNIDSSNEDLKYKRNLIRHNIIPELEKINKDTIGAINSLSKTACDDNNIINEYLSTINNPFNTEVFEKLSTPVQKRFIYNLFLEHNLDYDKTKINRILNFIKENFASKSGKKISLSGDMELFVNNKKIEIIKQKNIEIIHKQIDKDGDYDCGKYVFSIEKCTTLPQKFPNDCELKALVDLSAYKELIIRTRKDGDFIYPLNAGGKQKLKKYLNEKKVPAHLKDDLILLANGAEILWVPGLGMSDRIKVVNRATHVLKLKKKKP